MSVVKIERNIYYTGLIASAVYIFVIGFLSVRQYLCTSVAMPVCPRSPFTLLHLLMHSAFFGYMFLFLRKLPSSFQWKWFLLILTIFSFIGIVFMQRMNEVDTVLIYSASFLSILSFGLLLQENNIAGEPPNKLKLIVSIVVIIGLLMFMRAIT